MIDSIETHYGGVDFRFQAGADWASTLDDLGVAWEYEPQAITLPSGAVYIPDFWLPELGTWIEVKGHGIPRIEKAHELAATRACRCEGDCTCQWPGGELVVIGRAATECYDRTHRAWCRGGHLNWDGHPRPSWLLRCPECDKTGWVARTVPLLCRACRQRPMSGHLYNPGDDALRFRTNCLPDGYARAIDLIDDPNPGRWMDDYREDYA
ncbi:hypothetical protein [Streptomyces xiamenensis]|uniref:hypothetical protein n=1 Tax=Streptomyces xiamenensis TaxID=408015 RepID=UPI0037D32510